MPPTAPSLAGSGGALPFPPPASGPLVPLGGRAGEVGIYGTASAGQIVLHVSAPERNGAPKTQFTATVALAAPHGRPRALPVRGCGQGCFVAPARWARGLWPYGKPVRSACDKSGRLRLPGATPVRLPAGWRNRH